MTKNHLDHRSYGECLLQQESFDNKTHEKNDKRIIDTVGHTGNACRTRIVCQDVNFFNIDKKSISFRRKCGLCLQTMQESYEFQWR